MRNGASSTQPFIVVLGVCMTIMPTGWKRIRMNNRFIWTQPARELFDLDQRAILGLQNLGMFYSARMPASLITLPNRAMSDLIAAAKSCGEPPTVSTPALKNRSLVSGRLRNRAASWFSRLMSIAGELAGAYMPYIVTDS